MSIASARAFAAVAFVSTLGFSSLSSAADRVVYSDVLGGGFGDYSFANGGSIDLANTTPVHAGSNSIAFTGLNFGAVSAFYTRGLLSSSQYPTLRLWVNGGASGGQALRVFLSDTIGVTSTNAALGGFIAGGIPVANTWLLVDIPLTTGAFAAQPVFNRIDIQSDTAGAQPTVYLDDISLLEANVFSSSFEDGDGAELMFVPQYNPHAIRIYHNGPSGFVFQRTASLGGTIQPNALAFDPSGKLWVVDNNGGGQRRLLRYSRDSLLNAATPLPEVTISPIGGANGDIFDMAFFGASLYVSQSNFGAVNQVLRYSLSSVAASGSPAAAATYNTNLNIPAGLAFDRLGRLWISNNGNNTLVRLSDAGVVEWIGGNRPVGAARNALNNPEGLAFDAFDGLWVGNNGEPTITVYANWQTNFFGTGATDPVSQIDINPALFAGDTVGGLAFDAGGRMWANYQKTLQVLQYQLTPSPRVGGNPGDVGSYTSTPGQALNNGSSFPGFGGIAIWPVPDTLHR
jgi:sugar lactone lactonase YvrE